MKKLLLPFFVLALSCPAFGLTVSKTMSFENTTRNFLVHTPPGFTTAQHLPLVFNLHGYGSDAAQEEFYSRMSETSDANNFIVVYPNGLNNSWNSGFTVPYNSSPDDVGFISKIIDTMVTLYNIDLNRVYACGMSNGGYQSYRLACDLENRIAAIASVTGVISTLTAFNCTNQSRKMPVLHIHGTVDPLVEYNGSTGSESVEATVNFWVSGNQCSVVNDTFHYPDIDITDSSTVERIHYSSCGDGTEVMFYKITGGGHTWPNATFDYIYGPTNRDFDASLEIWNFFNRFALNGPVNGVEQSKEDLLMDVFPNPSNANFELRIGDFELKQPMSICVLDLSGRKVLKQKIVSVSTIINAEALARGVYLLKVEDEGFSATKKLVKE